MCVIVVGRDGSSLLTPSERIKKLCKGDCSINNFVEVGMAQLEVNISTPCTSLIDTHACVLSVLLQHVKCLYREHPQQATVAPCCPVFRISIVTGYVNA